MKKKCSVIFAFLLAVVCAFAFMACDFNEEQEKPEPVRCGTATVNYHYEYNVAIEHYYEVKYTVQIGKKHEITEHYTPPMKAGYRFLGWTTEEGGAGDPVGTPFSIEGSGFGGTVYNLYAKYEAIPFEIIYHLDGGTNHADNPTSLTGKKTLKNPTKEKHNFLGWYRDPEFNVYTGTASMIDDETTTVELYAKWQRFYEIAYVSDQPKVHVKGDQSTRPQYTFTEEDLEFTVRLSPEYFENYLFLGWECEDGGELIKEEIEITIDPKTEKSDRTFTARYLVASNPANTKGLRTLISYGKHNFYAREEVTRIVVEDKYGSKDYEMTNSITVYYSGENPPEVICREGLTPYLIRDPAEVEKHF